MSRTDPISDSDLDWNYLPFDIVWLNGRLYTDAGRPL